MRFRIWQRWQFGMRTLLALPVVVAIYFTLGVPTQRYGLRDVQQWSLNQYDNREPAEYHSPLLITVSRCDFTMEPERFCMRTTTSYYVWFFGLVIPLRDAVRADVFTATVYRQSDR
ncbi:MAG: hypothetical protein HKN47_17465 [Pirellulaceae bacterium]|nr:hypothetical protein [Pirellulaceae bacterium]